jgi:DNA-binding GntR family transcriptional regulator
MPPIHDTPLAVKPPHREILTDSVYEAVKALVMDRRIAPGARINIDRLARDLHVSPTPIREALARLESDGLVTKEALRGYSVAGLLDLPSFLQLYEMRLLLEPAAARKAAEVMTKEDLRAMGQQVATMQQARIGETYEEYRLFAAEDARFHDIIARASANAFLRDTLARLHAHLHLYRLHFQVGIAAETVAEHRTILEALRRGNAADAAAAMTEHIEQSRRRLSTALTGEH